MRETDTLVIGGGAAGCALAGLLAERSNERVLVVEAGPDYGPLAAGRWPAELLDASQTPPFTHEWGYDSGDQFPDRVLTFDRARVIGGCGAHNGCQAIIGHRDDYDAWAAAGNPGWSTADLEPHIASLKARLRVRLYDDDEITPIHRLNIEALTACDVPRVVDLNDLDQDLGVAPNPVNIVDGIRFNAAFAYLDPVRDRPNLTIVGDALCDRLVVEGGRVVGAVFVIDGRPETIRAARVVLAAGVYGSPAILLRSGIGDPAALGRLGIAVQHALPGVGSNLHDHPGADLHFAGTEELVARSRAFEAARFHPEEQVIAKLRTSGCSSAFDLHVYPVGGADHADPDRFTWVYMVGLLTSNARGSLTLRSADPTAAPILDHALLRDETGSDLARLTEGFEMLEQVLAYPELARLLGSETFPGPALRAAYSTREIVARSVTHCYHPVGTCKMGPASDPTAVVDATGRLHGLDGCFVADASIMPTVPRGNTHLPAVLVGERVAAFLAPV